MPGIAVEFLDVGMGDSTLVMFPPWASGQLALVDFGEKGSPYKVAARDALTYLLRTISANSRARHRNNPYLDYLFITHADGDHWNKLDWLIQGQNGEDLSLWETQEHWPAGTELEIGTLIYGGNWSEYTSRGAARAAIVANASANTNQGNLPNSYSNDRNAPFLTIPDGAGGNATVHVLMANYPTRNSWDANSKSIVLKITYGAFSVILTGDATYYAEAGILDRYAADLAFLRADGLKLGHHGSAGSSSAEWLAAVRPAAIFASGDRRWGHPYRAPIQRALALQPPSLQNMVNHRYACSLNMLLDGSGNYNNFVATQAICTNLWYVVIGDSVQINGQVQQIPAEELGTYYGVQYELFYNSGNLNITSTPSWPGV